MVVKVSKPELNLREKISELDKPSGIAGEAMLRAETPHEQQALIGVGRRNLVINGDFRIAQRGTTSTSPNYKTVDRWRSTSGSSANGTMHQAQTTDGPANEGHAYSYKYTSTSSTSSVPTGSDPWIKYEVASEDLTNLKLYDWKKELTLSFWIKTNQPGQHSISLNSGNFSGANYTVAYDINSTDWQKVIVTYPAPPIDLPSGDVGLRLYWSLGAGATYQIPLADTNRWQTGQGKYEAVGNKRIAGINNAFVQIAGVQLELGKVATPFEHRSYGEELALCQRYFVRFDGNTEHIGQNYSGGSIDINVALPVYMRSTPTLVCEDTQGTANKASVYSGGYNYGISAAISAGRTRGNQTMIRMNGTLSPAGTVNDCVQVQFDDLQFSAEL
jgi:hypothetical protein